MGTDEPEVLNGVRFDHCGGSGQIERAAWASFCKAMRGRRYGYNETSDAWAWFLKGWQGHISGPRSVPEPEPHPDHCLCDGCVTLENMDERIARSRVRLKD